MDFKTINDQIKFLMNEWMNIKTTSYQINYWWTNERILRQ